MKNARGIFLLPEAQDTVSNYVYFPIFVDEKEYRKSRDPLYEKLKQNNIFGRRYFYPLISEFSMYSSLESSSPDNLTVAQKMANEVICLPMYPDLDLKTVENICSFIQYK